MEINKNNGCIEIQNYLQKHKRLEEDKHSGLLVDIKSSSPFENICKPFNSSNKLTEAPSNQPEDSQNFVVFG
jgi:hypothetical protein